MTSKYKIADVGDLVLCPYHNTHMIRAERFPYHLMKCRRGYTGRDFVACPFNARHELPRPELRYHISTCPDKAVLDEDIKYAKTGKSSEVQRSTFKGNTSVPAYSKTEVVTRATENWDDEPPVMVKLGPNAAAFIRKKWSQTYSRPSEDEDELPLPTRNIVRLPDPLPARGRDPKDGKGGLSSSTKPSVYAYSLSVAGIGRGKAKDDKKATTPGANNDKDPMPEVVPTVRPGSPTLPPPRPDSPALSPVRPGSPTPSERSISSIASSIVGYKRMTGEKKAHASILQSLAVGRGIGRGLPISALRGAPSEASEERAVGLMASAE